MNMINVPLDLAVLSTIVCLDISKNQLEALPDNVGQLPNLRALRKDGQIQKVSLGMNSHRQHRAPHSEDGLWTPEVITDFIEAAPPGTFDSALLAYVSHR